MNDPIIAAIDEKIAGLEAQVAALRTARAALGGEAMTPPPIAPKGKSGPKPSGNLKRRPHVAEDGTAPTCSECPKPCAKLANGQRGRTCGNTACVYAARARSRRETAGKPKAEDD